MAERSEYQRQYYQQNKEAIKAKAARYKQEKLMWGRTAKQPIKTKVK